MPEAILWALLFAVGCVKSIGLLRRARRRFRALKGNGAALVYVRGLKFQETVRFVGIAAFLAVGILATIGVENRLVTLGLLFLGGIALVVNTFAADHYTTRLDEALGSVDTERRRGTMTPANRPTEWVAALAGLALAALAFTQDREVAAVASATLGFLPAIVTALATKFSKLARLRPTEVATGVAGIAAALILYADNRDLAALFSGIQAVVPAVVTGLVVATTPAAPAVPEPPEHVEIGDVDVESDL